MTDDLKKYRLKAEYIDLFRNFAAGKELLPKAAFDKQTEINRKSYDSEEQAKQHLAILGRLVDAGFVEVISTGITAVEK